MTPFRKTTLARSDRSGGFTLVDMLVALVLTSLLAGLMMGFLGQFRSIKRLQTDISAQAELDALAAYLEETIGGAMPLFFINGDPEKRMSLDGDRARLSFVTIARQGAQSFGLRETTIELSGTEVARSLMQSFRPRRFGAASIAGEKSINLADNITSITFRYLYYEGKSRSPIWSDNWTSRPGLPAAVQIDLVARRNGKSMTAEGHAILGLAAGTAE
jgi:type II secretory pathway component PulJ